MRDADPDLDLQGPSMRIVELNGHWRPTMTNKGLELDEYGNCFFCGEPDCLNECTEEETVKLVAGMTKEEIDKAYTEIFE